ncbi:MAG: hypothetical protein KDD48_08150, partial [Bdellovibrionales bacterium]|nr:hypothetical protein [Bdellovibrionales bacterium]
MTKLFKNTLTVSSLGFANLVIRLLGGSFMANAFGAGKDIDAYLIGITIPNFVLSIFVSAISAICIPLISEAKYKYKLEEAACSLAILKHVSTFLSIVVLI